jgi:TonB family protein
MKPGRVGVAFVIAVALCVDASAQDSLQTAKDFYASAAYEDALAVLTRLQRSETGSEIQQYRAFCLIALGRIGEAEKAIESVVVANPTYVPTVADVSPRIQEAFERTRRQLLPDIAREMYATGKAALDRKDRAAALAAFEGLVALIDASDPVSRDALDEIRFLAAGFVDLTRAQAVPAASPQPAKGVNIAAGSSPPAPPPAIVPPVAVRQPMPPWTPGDSVSRQASFTGSIRVIISAQGKVERGEIVKSVHPAYDRLLLEAVRVWEYQPARRDGVAVPSEQVVDVQLKPRQ